LSYAFFVRGFGCALFILWGNYKMSFSENFKKARRNSGLSQQQKEKVVTFYIRKICNVIYLHKI